MGFVGTVPAQLMLLLILGLMGCSPATIDFKQTPIARSMSLVLSITSPDPMTLARNGLTIQGICMDGIDVEVAGPGNSTSQIVPCVNRTFTAAIVYSAGDGLKTIQVSQFTRNTGLIVDNRNFLKDNTPPNISITGPAANSLSQGSITLLGTCETGYPVNIGGAGINGTTITSCNSGVFSANITLNSPDGTRNVVVTQTDGVGLTGTDNRNFLRDTTAPAIQIAAPAANSVFALGFTISGTCESGLNVVIDGTGISAPVTTSCLTGLFSTPVTFSILDGVKNFSATQTDLAGNIGTSSRAFVKDTTAPVITINSPAANTQAPNGITISGNCENGLTVTISGSGVASTTTTSCNGGTYTSNINFSSGDGIKSVTVSQTDAIGNSGSDSRNFVRDSQAPVLAFTNPAAGSSVASSATVQGTCETGLPVTLGGSGLSGSVSTNCMAGGFSSLVTFTSGDGSKLVTATQTDAAGNVGTTNRSFVRDTTGPAIAITSPAPGTSAQNGLTVSGTCETGLQVNLGGTGIASPVSTACRSGTFSAAITFSAGDGLKSIIASQTDSVGNSASDNRNFNKDTVAPLVTITSPAANSNVTSNVTVAGSCESGLSVVLNGSGAASPVTTPCPSGSFSALVVISVNDGIKNIVATQTDAAGNVGSDNRNFIKDVTGPVITINTPAPNTTAQTGLTITGICENGLMISVGGTGLSVPFSIMCNGGTYSTPITFSALDGAKIITVSQTDTALNTTTDTRTFIRDNTAPIIAITSPAAGSYVGATGTIQGTCESGLAVVLSGSGLFASATVNCNAGSFTAPVSFSSGDGSKDVVASQTDAAGNTDSSSRSFVRDSIAPVIAITSPIAGTVAQTGLTIQGTCESGLTVNISGAGASASSTTNCVGGSFSAAINFSSGDGSKNVIVSQTDSAGNTGSDNRNFIRDSSAPLLAITGPAAGTADQSGLTIVGVCETGLPVSISGTGISAPTTATCVSGSFSAPIIFSSGDGSKNIIVSQTDSAGNTSSDNRSFVKDTVAPLLTITFPVEGYFVGSTGIVSGTCESGINVVISGPGVSVPVNTACAAGFYSASVSFTSGDGSKTIIASQTDAASNQGSATRNVLRDSMAPLIAFTSPDSNTAAQSGLFVTGTCETGLAVTLSGTGVSSITTTTCSGGIFSANITFSSGDGFKTVTASQTDSAGNTGTANRNFIRDSTAPALAITSPAAGSYTNTGITIIGTCESGLNVSLTGTGISAPVSTACTSGSFSQTITFSPGEGAKNIIATQTDAVGNSSSVNRTFNYDVTAPIVTINSPSAGASVNPSFVIAGNCESGLTVVISGTGVTSPTSTSCVSGDYSTTINATSGAGNKNVIVSQVDLAGNIGSVNSTFVTNPYNGFETFTPNPIGQTNEQVDILFVDDNSASMETEQRALGSRFTSFINELSGVDWQIGITTTDVSVGLYGIQGSLLTMSGLSTKILTPSTPNADVVFANTIERPETVNCIMRGTCPSGLEQPLRASIMAMDKQLTDNAGFFRSNADLAIVILSDEDEMSDGRTGATTGQAVIDRARSLWPSKKISAYSIVILPGDSSCLAQQGSQFGATAYYGTKAVEFSNLTGGVTGSVCESDYSPMLANIGRKVVELINSVQLSRIPIPGSVSVNFVPPQPNITFTVSGDKVIFSAPPAPGTLVEVSYNY